MIYVLEGMPKEWATLYDFYSSLKGTEVPIYYIVYKETIKGNHIYRCAPSSMSLNNDFLGEVEVGLQQINTGCFNIDYRTMFCSDINPTEDWGGFQKVVRQNITDLFDIITDRNRQLYSQFPFLEKNNNILFYPWADCKLGLGIAENSVIAKRLENRYKNPMNKYLDPIIYATYFPPFSAYEVTKPPKFTYLDINIDEKGLVTLK